MLYEVSVLIKQCGIQYFRLACVWYVVTHSAGVPCLLLLDLRKICRCIFYICIFKEVYLLYFCYTIITIIRYHSLCICGAVLFKGILQLCSFHLSPVADFDLTWRCMSVMLCTYYHAYILTFRHCAFSV